jgi:hypothetical protein
MKDEAPTWSTTWSADFQVGSAVVRRSRLAFLTWSADFQVGSAVMRRSRLASLYFLGEEAEVTERVGAAGGGAAVNKKQLKR